MMRQIFLTAILTAIVLANSAFGETATHQESVSTAVSLNTDQDQLSYVFGLNIAMNFRTQHIAINQAAFMKGFGDGLAGTPPAMTPAQIKDVLTKFQKEMMAKQQVLLKAMADKNQKEGNAFMKAYAAQTGVTKLHDGEVLYKVITPGNGSIPQATDTVTLIYEGKLVDGAVFDSTKRNGNKPISLALNHMIPGVQEAIIKMPVGSTWEVVVSPKVAYGAMGVPGTPIGPEAILIFDLTLKGTAPTTAATVPAKS